ncbi:MAG: Chemotaxis protein methyltransferase CheR (EC [uncultured Sulfurovum sp.]|uniref:histidine kinase n=1 Tax=uncultured Sulfurovum sp. TaxID=269237 RepID=A0A6S6SZW0_9BACT|nr:MAG: Chemotaxis protein methyltransferase CheR (EC [uncultured Sulfurovum sp.]
MSKINKQRFEIVAIGASAGGFEALQLFIKNLKTDTDIAYVIAQHLDPKQPTMLLELLSKSTQLPILRVKDGEIPQKNHIYICPENNNITIVDFKFKLTLPEARIMPKPSVNIFLTSLAKDLEDKAVGIILSGTGSDGAEGIKAIKNAGGITLAQDERSAKYPSMPKAAIETGYVDAILTPELMASELPRIIKYPRILEEVSDVPKNLERIYDLLLTKHNVDFSDYKLSTIQRRIERRMSVNKVNSLEEYVTILEKSKNELHLLHKDFLVIVTSFFRNEEAFNSLESKINAMVHNYSETIRVWVAGCATGEEAYSLAMLFYKILQEHNLNKKVQIFATDISDDAIHKARIGMFQKEEIEHISEYYLENCFVKKDDSYEISKHIREMIIFSKHDIIKDPAFLNIDLISCRNLLIYFNNNLQRRVFSIFHHAFNGNGILFLGKSESTSNLVNFFKPIDSKWKIFTKDTALLSPALENIVYFPKRYPKNYIHQEPKKPLNPQDKKSLIFNAINNSILKSFAKDFLVIDRNNQIIFTNGEINKYIKIPVGSFSNDVFSFINEDIRIDLRTVLSKSRRELVSTNQRVRTILNNNDTIQYINILAFRLDHPNFLDNAVCVMFIESSDEIETQNLNINSNSDSALFEMENELLLMKERLQTTTEELETSNEELQSTNEELQSSNEELQSTNEELETSNEELQSSNEELTTVNDELEMKTQDLRVSNSDLENIFNSLKFAVVIIDRKLRIRKYTKKVNKLFDIRASDIGETITSIAFYSEIHDFRSLLLECLEKEESNTFELHSRGEQYNVLFQPYINENGKVSGLILSFYNISKIKKNENALKKAKESLEGHKLNLEEKVKLRTKNLEEANSNLANLLNSVNSIIIVSRNGKELINANQKFFHFFSDYSSLEMFNAKNTSLCDLFEVCNDENFVYKKDETFIYREKDIQAHKWIDFILRSQNKLFKVKIKKDGKIFIFDLKITLLNETHSDYLIAMNDITLLHSYQNSLELKVEQETNKRIEKEQFLIQQSKLASMGEMIGNIAHQWRQPLNTLSVNNILLLEKYHNQKLNEQEIEKFYAKSNVLIQNMSTTIDDFRDFFRPNKKMDFFDIYDAINEVEKFIIDGYDNYNINLNIKYSSKPLMYLGFKNELTQVLLNLLNNARDAIIINSTIEQGEVKFLINEEATSIQIEIEDNGGGIEEEILLKVFEPYFSTKFQSDGTGLGLYMSKMIVENSMHGTLKLENIKQGVIAKINLPKNL